METRKEKIRKAALRRRRLEEDSLPSTNFPSRFPDGGTRRYFYVAAGSLILALVAFVCGVQMGKTLGDLRESDRALSQPQTQKASDLPFRVVERGKEAQAVRDGKPRSAEGGEVRGEKTGPSPRPAPKVSDGKSSGPTEVSIAASSEEKKGIPPKAKYTLQVAAFNNPLDAQELVKQLKNKGYDAYQITGTGAAKGTLHRVRIGHFQTLQEARQFALTFEKKENMKTIISPAQNP